jgi:hypothetical protein
MKKTIFAVLLAGLALAAFAGTAAAQGPRPPREAAGPLHTYLVSALAERLGLSTEQVESDLLDGKTMYDLALEAGIPSAEIPLLLQEVHQAALEQAVEAGVIDPQQAEWMATHMSLRMQGDGLQGSCATGAGRAAGRMGQGMHGRQLVNP